MEIRPSKVSGKPTKARKFKSRGQPFQTGRRLSAEAFRNTPSGIVKRFRNIVICNVSEGHRTTILLNGSLIAHFISQVAWRRPRLNSYIQGFVYAVSAEGSIRCEVSAVLTIP